MVIIRVDSTSSYVNFTIQGQVRIYENYKFGEGVTLDLDKRNVVYDMMSSASYSYMEIDLLFYMLI